jgi:NAD(P)-dependent dehydrogenase (short-subunit alcohol dehydrogenase family)
MTQELKGKIAVVTGASRGIGRAIALRLAQDGAAVVFNHAVSAKPAQETVGLIKKGFARPIYTSICRHNSL